MTDREKTIVTAYTGVTMLQGEKLDLLYDYVSKLIGRPVQTLELVFLADKIQELSKPDFIKLCAEDTERRGEWIDESKDALKCSACGKWVYKPFIGGFPTERTQHYSPNYCAFCGTRMEGGE